MVLEIVNKNGQIDDTADLVKELQITKDKLDPVLKSLVALEYLILEVIERRKIELTDEGKSYAVNGSPEF